MHRKWVFGLKKDAWDHFTADRCSSYVDLLQDAGGIPTDDLDSTKKTSCVGGLKIFKLQSRFGWWAFWNHTFQWQWAFGSVVFVFVRQASPCA
jgi:hypothetical protein